MDTPVAAPQSHDPPLVFTDAAALKVADLIRGEGNPQLMLRVYVQGGGCSGLQYGFEFDEQLQDGDTCIDNHGVKLLVDPMSINYLGGAEIDFRDGLDGAPFRGTSAGGLSRLRQRGLPAPMRDGPSLVRAGLAALRHCLRGVARPLATRA